jgi:putative heme-binding domain-containing protein
MIFRRLVLMLIWVRCLQADAVPQWIWGPAGAENEVRFFRKTFQVPPGATGGDVVIAVDDEAEVSINRQRLGVAGSPNKPTRLKIRSVARGDNVLEIRARNLSGGAGLIGRIEFFLRDAPRVDVVTDGTWETSSDGSTGWTRVQLLGPAGTAPWGPISFDATATPVEGMTVKDGFRLELIHSARPGEGSWISMTRDDQGRLILSPQGSEPLLRVTIDQGKVAKMERLESQVGGAMGMLHAFGALYLNGRGPEGYHLYRIRDADGDGRFESTELLRRWKGSSGEHGPHALVKGPDDRIYAVAGNFSDVPDDLSPTSPVRHYAEDLAMPRQEDVNGFGAGRKAPGGFVLSVDRDGRDARLFSAGMRNAYGIAFNADGELFGFDSDMERDWGTPWYRPCRIQHLVSGSDHGYREGSGKWPEYYADSVPPVAEVGIGSPTGLRSGRGTAFPERYQKALLGLDWVFGRLIAVHLQGQGAGYTGRVETLFRGSAMNLTDLEVGPDGAIYCITGGRGTQSGLYRLTHVGKADAGPAPAEVAGALEARVQRRQIESFHGRVDDGWLASGWSGLGSPDPLVRHAARIALESQPVPNWAAKALAEENPRIGLTALLALARCGDATQQVALLKALARWPLDGLDEDLFLTKLRVIEVAFARHGIPDALRPMALEKLAKQFPAASWPRNRELSQLLVALGDGGAVAKILDLREVSKTWQEQLHYTSVLQGMTQGWTPELRQRYFAWFRQPPSGWGHLPAAYSQWFLDVDQKPAPGSGYDALVKRIGQKAFAAIPDAEKGPIAELLNGPTTGQPPTVAAGSPASPTAVPASAAPKRPRGNQPWRFEELADALSGPLSGRNHARGEQVYHLSQCAACHRFRGSGGATGPDLTGVSSRYSRADLWRSIVDPSAVVSEQYQSMTFSLKDGREITGRVLEESAAGIVIRVDPLTDRKETVKPEEVRQRVASKVSPMPEGLLSAWSREDILDLLAYLESDGRPESPVFKRR